MTDKISRYARRLNNGALYRIKGDSVPQNALVPPHRQDALSATHASEHNAVFQVDSRTQQPVIDAAASKAREEKVQKMKERDAKDFEAGKLDEEEYRARSAHDVAFLYPVPFYAATPGCVTTCGTYAPTSSCGPVSVD